MKRKIDLMRIQMLAIMLFVVTMIPVLRASAEEGDAPECENSVTITGVKPDDIGNEFGYVTFAATVNEDIENAKESCYLEIMNTDTGIFYNFDLYPANHYQRELQLPVGEYEIMNGGIANDFISKYPVEYVSFGVKNQTATVVAFSVGNVDDFFTEFSEPIKEKQGDVVTEKSIVWDNNEKVPMISRYVMYFGLLVLLITITGFGIYIWKKNN